MNLQKNVAVKGFFVLASAASATLALQACDHKELESDVTPQAQSLLDQPPANNNNNENGEPAKSQGPQEETSYTMEDVAKHNVKADCWIVIDGAVYNITTWFSRHPGGNAPVKYCGKDASAIFASIHPDSARTIAQQFRIGVLAK